MHGLLHHLGLPEIRVSPETGAARAELLPSQSKGPILSDEELDGVSEESSQDGDDDDLSDDENGPFFSGSTDSSDEIARAAARHDGIRPGIVHRLDKVCAM